MYLGIFVEDNYSLLSKFIDALILFQLREFI